MVCRIGIEISSGLIEVPELGQLALCLIYLANNESMKLTLVDQIQKIFPNQSYLNYLS